MKFIPAYLCLSIATILSSASFGQSHATQETFINIAKKANRPAGFPRPSAVCFSSRWNHPSSPTDSLDSFQAAADFHATGFYWGYGSNMEWFKEIKHRGYTFQGTLNASMPDTLFGTSRQKGRIVNEKGALVTASWMLNTTGWWGCLNSPEYRQVYLEYVKMYIDAGVDSLQIDDPGVNSTAAQWGGCYCSYCKAKAVRLGKTPADIQEESTDAFYAWIRREIRSYARRYIPFSCNSHPGRSDFLDTVFDFGMEEMENPTASRLYQAMRDAEQHRKALMYTFRSKDAPTTRRVIALAYGCGTHIIVPWDVFMPGLNAPRYYGKPEDYADLYGMVRQCSSLLDGYEDAAFAIPGLPDNRYLSTPIAVAGGSGNVCLFVRAAPGNADAPVVIHCVEMAETPKPFRLTIDPSRLFGERSITVDLLIPAPYDRIAHTLAEQTGNFAPLVIRKRLAEGRVSDFEVPAVTPWGLVVIAPAN